MRITVSQRTTCEFIMDCSMKTACEEPIKNNAGRPFISLGLLSMLRVQSFGIESQARVLNKSKRSYDNVLCNTSSLSVSCVSDSPVKDGRNNASSASGNLGASRPDAATARTTRPSVRKLAVFWCSRNEFTSGAYAHFERQRRR